MSWPTVALSSASDSADRCRNIVTITPADAAHVRRLDRVLADVQDDLLAPLSQAERTQLTRLLTRVLDYHGSRVAQVSGG
jgi:MarR family transcriptional regulator, lower aerobic nicotinate degradation pathway regulator